MSTSSERGPISLEDRGRIRAALGELARSANTTLLAAMAQSATSSTAIGWSNSSANLPSRFGPRIYKSACNSLAFSSMAAADNVDSFISCLKAQRATVSLATLTRGAVEAFGRAYFLLKATSDIDFYVRYLSLSHEELKYPERHSGMTDAEGNEIDGRRYRAEMVELSTKLGVSKMMRVDLSSLVAEVLEPMVDGPLDLAIYSQLSGVAHGTSSAIGMFMAPGATRTELIFPRDIALEYTGYLYAAAVTVTERVVEIFQPDQPVRDRWTAARDRSSMALAELRD